MRCSRVCVITHRMFTIGIDMNTENSSPPHVVDSGASVMDKEAANTEIQFLRQYIAELEKALESSLALNKEQAERYMDQGSVKKFSDEWWKEVDEFNKSRKAQEK